MTSPTVLDHITAGTGPGLVLLASTLVLASADDQVIPSHHQRELAEAISDSRYLEVPGGHRWPFDDPDRFFSIITDFVDAQQAAVQAGVSA